jgi:hypothetical protein
VQGHESPPPKELPSSGFSDRRWIRRRQWRGQRPAAGRSYHCCFARSLYGDGAPLVGFSIRITSATGMRGADAEIEGHTYDPRRRPCDRLGSGHHRLLGGAGMGDLVGDLNSRSASGCASALLSRAGMAADCSRQLRAGSHHAREERLDLGRGLLAVVGGFLAAPDDRVPLVGGGDDRRAGDRRAALAFFRGRRFGRCA